MKERKMNTVLGIAEPVFRQVWMRQLMAGMATTGHGFRKPTLKRRPPEGAAKFRGERRGDKVGMSKVALRLLSGPVT
jgi:hypothetical protein